MNICINWIDALGWVCKDLQRNKLICSDAFVDPTTGRIYKEGDLLKRESLGKTLQLFANSTDPIQLFYHGKWKFVTLNNI